MKYFLVVLLLIFSGCSQNIANFTIVSTKSTNLDNKYESVGQIEGYDITYIITIIPLGRAPRMDEAVANTLLNNGADYLTNTVVKSEVFFLPYIFGYNKIEIRGEGWRIIDEKLVPETQIKKRIIRFNPDTGEPIYN